MAGIFLFFAGGVSLLISSLFFQPRKTALFTKKTGVGVVELKGLITTPEKIIASLTAFRKNEDVKSIILRIDSPGGTVGASQEIYEEVKRTNAVKPVVASMGSVGASGGYYAALGAQKIIANPGTITGSIGVIAKFANLEKLFEKIGYKSEVIKSGQLKDIGATNRPMTAEERALLQELINNLHGQFVKAVAESRVLPEQEVRRLADGRIFSGEQALEAGLIDALGNFTDAIILAARLGGLDTETPELIYPRKKMSLWDIIAGNNRLSLDNFIPNTPILSYEWTGIIKE